MLIRVGFKPKTLKCFFDRPGFSDFEAHLNTVFVILFVVFAKISIE